MPRGDRRADVVAVKERKGLFYHTRKEREREREREREGGGGREREREIERMARGKKHTQTIEFLGKEP